MIIIVLTTLNEGNKSIGDVMSLLQEIRFMVETVTDIYCTSGIKFVERAVKFTEGDGQVYQISLDDIQHIYKEVITREEIEI